jgi:large conductance mechanosensitive channel
MLQEFKTFINKGNVVTIAVGLVMALAFQEIVTAFLDGVINPIIAAIFGESAYQDIGFDIGDARIRIGLVINAIIYFVAVSLFLFFVVKAYNRWRRTDPTAMPSDNELLVQIRDLLAAQQQRQA